MGSIGAHPKWGRSPRVARGIRPRRGVRGDFPLPGNDRHSLIPQTKEPKSSNQRPSDASRRIPKSLSMPPPQERWGAQTLTYSHTRRQRQGDQKRLATLERALRIIGNQSAGVSILPSASGDGFTRPRNFRVLVRLHAVWKNFSVLTRNLISLNWIQIYVLLFSGMRGTYQTARPWLA